MEWKDTATTRTCTLAVAIFDRHATTTRWWMNLVDEPCTTVDPYATIQSCLERNSSHLHLVVCTLILKRIHTVRRSMGCVLAVSSKRMKQTTCGQSGKGWCQECLRCQAQTEFKYFAVGRSKWHTPYSALGFAVAYFALPSTVYNWNNGKRLIWTIYGCLLSCQLFNSPPKGLTLSIRS